MGLNRSLMTLLMCGLLIGSQIVFAADYAHNVEGFDAAKNNPTYIRFEGHNKIFWLFSMGFQGYATQFKAYAVPVEDGLDSISLVIPVEGLATGLGFRDSKLKNEVLRSSEFDKIVVRIDGKVPADGNEFRARGGFEVLGDTKPLDMFITIKKEAGNYVVEGRADLSLTKLQIEAPTFLGIAKVEDAVVARFHVEVPTEVPAEQSK